MIEDRESLAQTPERTVALDCLEAGIDAAHPESVIDNAVELDGEELIVDGSTYDLHEYDRVFVVGGGNAAGQIANMFEQLLDDIIDDGVVVTDDPVLLSRIECIEGNHPVPNEQALEGVEQMIDLVEDATQGDLVLSIVAGGGSALLPSPAGDLDLHDLQSVTEGLLTSGASINEINAVRKHLSAIKGGRLAQSAAPATQIGVVFSDVIGSPLNSIASGPISPDDTTYREALDVLDQYDISTTTAVRRHLQQGSEGERRETPAAGNDVFDHVTVHILADNLTALAAASGVARDNGYEPMILSSRIRGEASEAAKSHVAIAEEAIATGNPVEPPAVLLSGGETTVTVANNGGDGGPNQEFALSGAIELSSSEVVLGSVDTDGIDGTVDVAGALVDGQTVENIPDAQRALACNDVYGPLDAAGALIRTGQTGTNVNDLRVLVIPER